MRRSKRRNYSITLSASASSVGGTARPVLSARANCLHREQRTTFCTMLLRYLKVIRSVRLSVEALSFKGSLVAFALC